MRRGSAERYISPWCCWSRMFADADCALQMILVVKVTEGDLMLS